MELRKDNNMMQSEWDDEMKSVLKLSDQLQMQKSIDVDKNWSVLQHRIHQEKNRISVFYWIRNIAAILLLPLIVLSIYLYDQTSKLKSIPVNQLETVTAYGIRTKVVLSDGSEVWLNSGSKLIYPEKFTGDTRLVTLSGEAYFKVKSDKDHRFDVKTSDGIKVSAYGTEFNVEAYEEDVDIRATLVDGSIGVEQIDFNTEKFIKPGEQVVYSKNSKKMFSQEANLLVETGWREGKLVFRRTPMPEVVKNLSRHFNVNIQLQGKELFDYTYSATFTTESLVEILSLLERTAPIICETIEPEQQWEDLSFTRKTVLIHKK